MLGIAMLCWIYAKPRIPRWAAPPDVFVKTATLVRGFTECVLPKSGRSRTLYPDKHAGVNDMAIS